MSRGYFWFSFNLFFIYVVFGIVVFWKFVFVIFLVIGIRVFGFFEIRCFEFILGVI